MNQTNRAIAIVVSVVVVAFCLIYALTLIKPGIDVGIGSNVDVTKSEALQAGDDLTVDATISGVTVTLDPSATSVTAHLYGSMIGINIGSAPALDIVRNGSAVTVQAGKNTFGHIGWNLNLKLDITVPAGFSGNFDCHSGAGAVTMNSDFNVKSFRANSSAGAVRVLNVTASGAVEISSSSGGVEAGNITADSLDMHSSAGRVSLGSCTARNIKLHSSAGSVSAGGLNGKVEDASSSAGSVDVTLASVVDSADISSSAGSVRVTLPANANAKLNASTSAGSVDVRNLTLSNLSQKRDNVQGTLGDGGPEIRVHSSAGSVQIDGK